MTVEDIKQHRAFHKVLNNRAYTLFNFIKQKYADLLDYWYKSCYNGFTLEENSICIEYYDKAYGPEDITTIEFPLDDFCNDIVKAADEWADEVRRERAEIKKAEQQKMEDSERRLYEHLKAKYGN